MSVEIRHNGNRDPKESVLRCGSLPERARFIQSGHGPDPELARAERVLHLCRVVWPSELRPTDRMGGKPMSGTRHPHRRRVRWAVSTAEGVMLIGFRLKSSSLCVVAAASVVIGQPLIPVEEINVGLRREVGIPADARHPNQHFRRHQIQA